MKKLTISLALLLGIAVITITGLELFSTYKASVDINHNAPVQTTKRIVIKASPEKVWAIMSKVNQWSEWHKDVQEPIINGDFEKGTSFDWKSGGLSIHSTIHTADPYAKIGWSGKAFGAFAIHNWAFIPLSNGYTEVQVEESMEGWLVWLMQKKFQSGLEKSLDIWLSNLKTEAEKQ